MENALNLFGQLILTLLALVIPIFDILLSLFTEGVVILTTQYENERVQTETNLKDQLKKLVSEGNKQLDTKEIKNNLKLLEKTKKNAESKLSYLNPKKQLFKLVLLLCVSFIGIEIALIIFNSISKIGAFSFSISIIPVFISIIAFLFTIYLLINLSKIFVEVKISSDQAKKDKDQQFQQILLGLQDINYLKNVYVSIENENIHDGKPSIQIKPQLKKSLSVSIDNEEKRMVKNVEIGFCLPLSFIIEKTSYYTIYNDVKTQIVRYKEPTIQGKTNVMLNPLIITALENGSFKIRTFIKAENIEANDSEFTIEVI